MKKNEKNNVKSDVITGASSAVGATIGMMAGNALATEVSATDEVPQPEKPSKPTAASPAQPATNAEQQAGNTAGNQPSAVANNEVNNVTINQTNIGDNNNNNLQVQPEPQPVIPEPSRKLEDFSIDDLLHFGEEEEEVQA